MPTDRAGQLKSVTGAATDLADLFLSKTTSTAASPTTNAQEKQLFDILSGQATSNNQDLIDAIMQRSAIAFAPTLGEQVASGGYNSTALQQLQGEARARATAESVKAVKDAQLQAAQVAAQLTAASMQQNKTVTQQPQVNKGTLADLAKALVLGHVIRKGVSAGGKALGSVYDKITGPSAVERAAGSDAGTLYPPSGAPAGSDVGVSAGASDFGSVAGGQVSSTGFQGEFGSLSSEELSSIMAAQSESVLGNSAALGSLTDYSVAGGEAGLTDLGVSTGADFSATSASDLGTLGATSSDVLSSESSATALGASSGVVEAGGFTAAETAAASDAGTLFTADAASVGAEAGAGEAGISGLGGAGILGAALATLVQYPGITDTAANVSDAAFSSEADFFEPSNFLGGIFGW